MPKKNKSHTLKNKVTNKSHTLKKDEDENEEDEINLSVDSCDNKHIKNKKQNKSSIDDPKDSSVISDMDDNESIDDAFNYDAQKKTQSTSDEDYDEMSEEEKKKYIETVVLDRVIKYIKLDDVIKQKQNEHKKEMKAIKDSKEQLEQFLIGYLDKVDEEYIQLGNKSTLIKTEVKTKAPPKMEDISVCLIEGFKKYDIYNDDVEIKRVVKDFIDTIDAKREVKIRKYLKRTTGDSGEIVQKNKKQSPKTIKK